MNDELPSGGASKLGEQVAARLEALVRSNAWPMGHRLGNEEELSQTFGASRATIREAIAIAEWNGLVERRRGREGGLYISAQTLDPAISRLRNYLFLSGAGLSELIRARRIVEGHILHRAMQQITAIEAADLADLSASPVQQGDDWANLDRLKRIVDRLSDLAGIPLLRLFGSALRHCFVDRVRTTTLDDGDFLAASRAVGRHRTLQVDAIRDFDQQTVRDLQTRAMDVWAAFAAQASPARLRGAEILDRLTATGDDALIYAFVRPAKKPEAVARAIAQMIADRGLREGERLGVETELMADFDISRRVFREAVRILEWFGIVESGRGKFGGLMVGRPQREALLASFREDAGSLCGPQETEMLLRILLLDVCRSLVADPEAARRCTGEGTSPSMSAAQLARLLARHAPDPVIGCLAEIVVDVRERGEPSAGEPLNGGDVARFLAALAAGDRFAAPRILDALYRAG